MNHDTERQHPIASSSELKARRWLLKAIVYAPPVILGVMVVNPSVANAAAKTDPPGTICPGGVTVSCAPTGCCPCVTNPASKKCGDGVAQTCQDSNFTCTPCDCAPCINNPECVRDVCKDQIKDIGVICAPCNCTPCTDSARCSRKSCKKQLQEFGVQCGPCTSAACDTDPKCQEDFCDGSINMPGGSNPCTPCSCAPCFCGPNNDGANTCAPDGGCAPTGDVDGNCN